MTNTARTAIDTRSTRQWAIGPACRALVVAVAVGLVAQDMGRRLVTDPAMVRHSPPPPPDDRTVTTLSSVPVRSRRADAPRQPGPADPDRRRRRARRSPAPPRNQVRWRFANATLRRMSAADRLVEGAPAVEHVPRLAVADRRERRQPPGRTARGAGPPRRGGRSRTGPGHGSRSSERGSPASAWSPSQATGPRIAHRRRQRRIAPELGDLEGANDPPGVAQVDPGGRRWSDGAGAGRRARRGRRAASSASRRARTVGSRGSSSVGRPRATARR